MKTINILLLVFLFAASLNGQKYFTKQGHISFTSNAPLEKIEAENHKATCVIDTDTGKMEWAVLIKAFNFEKALMQEHFNENYMESSKYPKATFKGTIDDIESVDFATDGNYTVNVTGHLTIHGVTQDLATNAEFRILNGEVKGSSLFTILVADYEIDIPKVVKDNIAKEVEISVNANFQELKKS